MAYSAISTISNFLSSGEAEGGPTLNQGPLSGLEMGKPKNLSRYFGGHSRTSHPYVNGYWQFLISPPCTLFGQIPGNAAAQWFHSTAEGFTPPTRNLNKADLPGQGGVGSSWVTGQSLMRTFSVTHREYRDLPMMKLFELWTSIIVPQIGVSEVKGEEWAGRAYKGHAFAILTKPTGSLAENEWKIDPGDIEEVYYFDGVWPENAPYDALSQDISSNDIVQYTINYSFDGWPLTKEHPEVVRKAVELLGTIGNYQQTYDIYTQDLKEMSLECVNRS